jgi:F420-dependent oxidoreductase-like protein
MRFILWIGTEQAWPDIRRTAELAETTGWDGVYLADLFMPNEEPPSLEPRLEAWTALSALAAVTEQLRLGVLVSGNTYRHPAIVAKMAATADRVSGGRVVLGLGAGWQVSEHLAYGIELPEIRERLSRLEEACEVVRLLLSTERANFEGSYYRLSDAPCEPKPVQARLPLLLGVSGERVSMRLAARFADIWNCWGTPDLIGHKIDVLERHCEDVGRDPATVERSAQALVMMSEDGEEVSSWRAEHSGPAALIGGPGEIAEELAAYEAIGLDEFVVSDRTLGEDLAHRHETMARFLEEVAAPFRS